MGHPRKYCLLFTGPLNYISYVCFYLNLNRYSFGGTLAMRPTIPEADPGSVKKGGGGGAGNPNSSMPRPKKKNRPKKTKIGRKKGGGAVADSPPPPWIRHCIPSLPMSSLYHNGSNWPLFLLNQMELNGTFKWKCINKVVSKITWRSQKLIFTVPSFSSCGLKQKL